MTEQQLTPAEATASVGRALTALRPAVVHAMTAFSVALESLRPAIGYYQQHPEEQETICRERDRVNER